jgi:hypothetical protein
MTSYHDHDHAQYPSTQKETPMPNTFNANDNGNNDNVAAKPTTSVAAAAKGSTALTAMAAVAAIGTALNGVDTSIGRSDKPMMFFKSRENIWTYGRQQIEPEEGSRWAVNPMTFQRGYVAFDGSKKVGERMLFVGLPKIDPADLPDVGFPWQEQMSVEMKCLSGADAGVEVCFKAATVGGNSCVLQLIEQIRNRISAGQHGDKIVPILLLEKSGYQHQQYGWIGTPQLNLVAWTSLNDPAPAPAEGGGREPPREPPASPPPTEQPRRRREPRFG